MLRISSKDNKIYKFVKSLQTKKARVDSFAVEGIKNVQEAAKAGVEFEYVCFSEDKYDDTITELHLPEIHDRNTVVFSKDLFSKLSDTVTPQGVLAVISKDAIQKITDVTHKDVFAVLENIQDPGNMGTVIRTCNAAGITGLITVGNCVDIFSPKVVRSSMGGIFNINLLQFDNTKDAISYLKKNGIMTYALAPGGNTSIYDICKWEGVALFVGNEANGLDKETVSMCDNMVNIPMLGNSESLNASVAISLAVYESVRYKVNKS